MAFQLFQPAEVRPRTGTAVSPRFAQSQRPFDADAHRVNIPPVKRSGPPSRNGDKTDPLAEPVNRPSHPDIAAECNGVERRECMWFVIIVVVPEADVLADGMANAEVFGKGPGMSTAFIEFEESRIPAIRQESSLIVAPIGHNDLFNLQVSERLAAELLKGQGELRGALAGRSDDRKMHGFLITGTF